MAWNKANPERFARNQRRSLLKKRYGITPEQYDEIFKRQGGVCAICLAPPGDQGNRLAVDHCHSTGTVRGLLCFKCNTFLGRIDDSPEAAQRVVAYLLGRLQRVNERSQA